MKRLVSRMRAGGIAIVGPGRLGQAMGKLLHRTGFDLQFVAARRKSAAKRGARFTGASKAVTIATAELSQASIFLLTTSDAAVPTVASLLADSHIDWKRKIVLHTSGSLSSSVLMPLRKRGASIGSIHPYQTIPNPAAGVRNLTQCYWGVEGDSAAIKEARRWVKAWKGVAFRIDPAQKSLYHASAFLVCPTLVTLMDRSMALLKRSGVPEKIARPMLARFVVETVKNFEQMGARRALTGPASRGDWSVIREHLRALRKSFPDVVPVYAQLVLAMLRLAGRRPPNDLRKILGT